MTVELTIPAERSIPRARLEARRRHLVAELSERGEVRGVVRRRRTWLLPVGGLAAAAVAAAIVFVGVGGNGGETASAATVLREAAAVARQQAATPEPGPGEYLYVRSVNAYLTVFSERDSFAVLVPREREVWLGPNGGKLRETSSEPIFLSPRDRERWIAAGRPDVRDPVTVTELEPSPPLRLPDDPGALYERLERQAAGHPEGVHEEMFTLVGDALRETSATPAQRAALFEVASRIPGVDLVGEVTDPAGRPGIAVAMEHEVDGILQTLVFDPETSLLLAEEQRTLAENEFGYAEATVIGYATYHDVAIVDSKRERP